MTNDESGTLKELRSFCDDHFSHADQRYDHHSFDGLIVEMPEILIVAGHQVLAPGTYRSAEDRLIFLNKIDRQGKLNRWDNLDLLNERLKFLGPLGPFQHDISPGFFEGKITGYRGTALT